jgi:hypothetical protein
MERRDELLTIADFSGVVAAFLQPGGLHRVDRVRFVTLFTTAFSTLVLTFVPLVPGFAGLTGTRLWSGSSLVMVILYRPLAEAEGRAPDSG